MPAKTKTPPRPAPATRRSSSRRDAARAAAIITALRDTTPPGTTPPAAPKTPRRVAAAPDAYRYGAYPARWARGDVHAPRWSADQVRAPRPLEPIAAVLARVARRGWTVTDAERVIGGLSNPSKMPCPSWSIPARTCQVGSRLANVPGSTCASCYARKGMYILPNTESAMIRRLSSLRWALTFGPDAREAFTAAMSYLVSRGRVFRWHDSGDIQSAGHLAVIVDVATRTPGTRHWVPTREARRVRAYIDAGGEIPRNLVIRASAPMVGMPPAGGPLPTSGVHRHGALPEGARECRAFTRDGACGGCRACWNPATAHVSYPLH